VPTLKIKSLNPASKTGVSATGLAGLAAGASAPRGAGRSAIRTMSSDQSTSPACSDIRAVEYGQLYQSANLHDGTSPDALVFSAPLAYGGSFYLSAPFPAAQQVQA
jgi:hypothetical protein